MALQEELRSQGDFLFRNRSYFPLLFLLVSLLAYVAEVRSGNQLIQNDTYWFFSLAVGVLGLLIRVVTVGFTPRNTSGRNTSEGQVADELNETGIYSVVRHPLYLGNFFMWLGVGMLVGNIWFILAFTFIYWIYYERIMFAEEAFLRDKFGGKYLEWAADKPAFIPALKTPLKPRYPFSLKKVLKKEKNGITALAGLFWIFDLIRTWVITGDLQFQKNIWFWIFLGSLAFYVVFKALKEAPFMRHGR